MNLNVLIKDFKHIEKLNKTNTRFKKYKLDFEDYISKSENVSIIFEKLSLKSSCLPYIINLISEKDIIYELLGKINSYILNNVDNLKILVNFLVNILSIPKIKYCFLDLIKKKSLINTIFKKVFTSKFEKFNISQAENYFILDSIFFKIFENNKSCKIFNKILDNNVSYKCHNEEENITLINNDIFNKYLIIILSEVFNKKYSFLIKELDKHENQFSFFKNLHNLIENNYIHLLEEINYINKYKKEKTQRISDIYSIIKSNDYINLILNFYDITIIWLINIEINNFDKKFIETIIKNIYTFMNYNINSLYGSRNTYTFFEQIFLRKFTDNHHIIMDYIFLVSRFISNSIKYKKYKYFDYQYSRIINTIPNVCSFMYDNNKNNSVNVLDFMLEFTHLFHITLFLHQNYRKLMFNYLKSNYKLKKMTCIAFESIDFCIDNLKHYLIENYKENSFTYTINYYYNSLNGLLLFIKNMSYHYKNIVISEELKPFLITIMKSLLKINKNISLDNKDVSITYNKNIIYKKIKDILFFLRFDSEFCSKLDLEDLKLNITQNPDIDIEQLKFFNNIVFRGEDTSITHDSEFCDPITDILIKTPIMLPNNIIVEKSMICRYLLTNKMNPFNRQPLTIKILDEYNQREEIVDKISNFKSKLINYINSINI
jgi:hypothetical protein